MISFYAKLNIYVLLYPAIGIRIYAYFVYRYTHFEEEKKTACINKNTNSKYVRRCQQKVSFHTFIIHKAVIWTGYS